MAFSLTGLEQWTTWILLGLLAVWDLVAVLCPFGPLRLLLESSKKQQKEVPALLYSVNAVWLMMASTDQLRLSRNLQQEAQPSNIASPGRILERYSASYSPSSFARKSHDGFMRLPDDSHVIVNNSSNADQSDTTHSCVTSTLSQGNIKNNEDEDDDTEKNGLKLGLGDFVFYSVLIARAAMYDWITTVCCTIAVLTGLTATIFLLAIYKKALPALPISIAFGILFYFVAKTVLVPYVAALCVFDMVGL
ncbi:Presenilin-domain-containing protein [Gilbertella persicaria]|uniref:Presenilin n=1 Tax=Rhizopus stolonifer TaxID=4846 RepID=A0A367KML8_RHIST|nr:Presenilin-domain-containing protein [Gilbertella persicaria]KAI8097939.1 Presenilin-domain-containing protein [Gilbertella persicaria]RCI03446.1 Presenilin-1 [Rhizopus stolonifer]